MILNAKLVLGVCCNAQKVVEFGSIGQTGPDGYWSLSGYASSYSSFAKRLL